MANRSYQNSGFSSLSKRLRKGDSVFNITRDSFDKTFHAVIIQNAVEFLKAIPNNSIQLILIDPPYNLNMAAWDRFPNYIEWASQWIDEVYRILTDSGNCVIFGGFQFQDLKRGDLLEILHYIRHNTPLCFINLIIWYYKNGMSAYRFFANRHEEAIWLSKTKNYFFDLDAVRIPYDAKSKQAALKDKRLIPENIEKGKNPTNVWEIGRLNGNSSERVGHPTQKPLELIRRFVKSLSFEGSIVLDFFAGSGTTGRICIEENRHSILVDNNILLKEYLKKHLDKMKCSSHKPYEINENITIQEYFQKINTFPVNDVL